MEIFLHQRKYARDLLLRFGLRYCKASPTPMNANEKLQFEDGTSATNPSFYRSLIGGLNYLTRTRPDVMFSMSMLSRYMHNPTKQYLGADKRVRRYIAGTIEFGIWYAKESKFRLVDYCDSEWLVVLMIERVHPVICSA